MSKKDRLQKQKEKQEELRLQKEKNERIDAELAKNTMSKSAQKMMKKAKKEKKYKPRESALFLILKILMFVPFAYSGFFYGGVRVIGILSGYMDGMAKWVGYAMGAGSIVIFIGIILAFCRKYFASFVVIAAGTASYMKAAGYIVGEITKKLENYSGAEPELMDLDKDYMLQHYPIMIILVFSLIMAIITLVKLIKKKKRLKELRDNAPVKSIVNS